VAELGRGLVEGTIDSLLEDATLTRQSIKGAFASLTIGSASAALVLCDRRISQRQTRLLGGIWQNDTAAHLLCAGGVEAAPAGDSRPRMDTDSEALLEAGIQLAEKTWVQTQQQLGWQETAGLRAFTHQVGKAHRRLLLERLHLPANCDFPIYDRFGNTGAAALPLSLALGAEANHIPADSRVALLGIGSGLNSLMLGLHWQSVGVQGEVWEGDTHN
jgi:3-oxoacyl-[acyl-carrier-protein] synthase III